MNKKTARALDKSIEHWERMKKNPLGKEKPYSRHCPLCAIFLKGGCIGCPVMLKTKMDTCDGTPWFEAKYAWNDVCYEGSEENTIKWERAADKMIEFLKSLKEP